MKRKKTLYEMIVTPEALAASAALERDILTQEPRMEIGKNQKLFSTNDVQLPGSIWLFHQDN